VLKMNNIKHNSHSLSIQNESFATLLLGNDINSYSMARAFHERYGIRSTVYGKYPTSPCHNSQIIDYHACEQIDLPECFIETRRYCLLDAGTTILNYAAILKDATWKM